MTRIIVVAGLLQALAGCLRNGDGSAGMTGLMPAPEGFISDICAAHLPYHRSVRDIQNQKETIHRKRIVV